MKAVDDKIHSPQRWHPNKGTLIMSSKKSRKREIFLSFFDMGGELKLTNLFFKAIFL